MSTQSYAEREALIIAPYAMHSVNTQGRHVAEEVHPYRSPYQRDRDRITHSSAFRRLSRKTQVFTRELGTNQTSSDYHRTRLTHTLEVASIARTLGRSLRLNEDLIEALALGHDVGHPPFGHAGEAVLNGLLTEEGGFNHNRQALRIFEKLEERYPDRAGLNLTVEVLEGQQARGDKKPRSGAEPIVEHEQDGRLLETQVVDAADSIAYDAHDADDALEAGLILLNDMESLQLWRESIDRIRKRYTALSDAELRRATIHELIDRQVSDLLTQIHVGIKEHGLTNVEQVRLAPTLACHSTEFAELKLEFERFLFTQVYRHPLVLEHRAVAIDALEALFQNCLATPDRLPKVFQSVITQESLPRGVADFVASLTDDAVLKGNYQIP